MPTLAFMQNIGWMEMFALLALGLLLFGRRLPEVGRSLGRGIVEFKRGLKGIDEDIEQESSRPTKPPSLPREGEAGTVDESSRRAQATAKPLPPHMGGPTPFQAPDTQNGAKAYETPAAAEQRVSRSDVVE